MIVQEKKRRLHFIIGKTMSYCIRTNIALDLIMVIAGSHTKMREDVLVAFFYPLEVRGFKCLSFFKNENGRGGKVGEKFAKFWENIFNDQSFCFLRQFIVFVVNDIFPDAGEG